MRRVVRSTIHGGWARLIALIAIVGTGLVLTVQAVHDAGFFQLDGNAASPAGVPADWDRVCHEVSPADCPTATGPSGATAVSWSSDNLIGNGPSLNATIFTGGGSKDPSDVNQWAWKDGAGGLPDKDNLLHSFAARYSSAPSATCPAGTAATCEILYFGSDRLDNSGDAQQGFWFFQNPVGVAYDTNADGIPDTPCPQKIGGGTGFCDPRNGNAATHVNGDLLIISDFSNGGTTSTITVYKWNNAVSGNLQLLATSDAANCTTAGPADQFCGLVNADTITMPWAFTDKSGTPARGALNGEFYEGGINLSLLGLAGECFAAVASESRSSTSTTATLKDFVLGGFAACTSGLTTTPKDGSGANIPATGLSIGTGQISVKDSATLQVGGVATWSGTLKFFLCGPDDLAPATAQATCVANGTQVGPVAGVTVSNLDAQPFVSAAATLTKVGKYCWRSTFTATTSGVPDASDAAATECFTVNPVTPSLTTTASGTVEIGNPVSDTASLLGTASQPGSPVVNGPAGSAANGTITFKLYGPFADAQSAACTTLASGFPTNGIVVNVSGDGSYPSGNFTPVAAGTYIWGASYSGSAPNTNSVNGVCPAALEIVVVTPKTPNIITVATAAPPDGAPVGTALNDTATLSGTQAKPDGTPAGGTITFTLYGPVATNTATCTTTLATRVVNVSGDGNYTASSGTGSGSLTPTAAGYYFWIAAYSGDAPNTQPKSGACGDANETSFIKTLTPTIATKQFFYPNDSATVTVVSGGNNLAGTVRFRAWTNNTCNGATLVDQTLTLATGTLTQTVETTNTTARVSVATSGNPIPIFWRVDFDSTNPAHDDVPGTCGMESSSISVTDKQ